VSFVLPILGRAAHAGGILTIRATGFRIDAIEAGYMTGPKPWTFMYQGPATK
jgi:hypothetical protein